jgi:Rps23 Pro-64 3,4-dihydroxylase Tpa1-like proline 4-hydroxylase
MPTLEAETSAPSLFARFDRDELKQKFQTGIPVPNMCVDNFLDESLADQIVASFPTFDDVRKVGKEFTAVNEKKKVQVTDPAKFPPPIAELNRLLAAPAFLDDLSYITGIPNLLADPSLSGGGIHATGSQGHLDVHVDFNFHREMQAHRRLNILIYFNKGWQPQWGGEFELWDKDVKVCHHRLLPIFNRMAIFETNEISFHGVRAVKCPAGEARKSFAGYYYTKEAPAHWDGTEHSTLFRARPNELVKGKLLMPGEKAGNWIKHQYNRVKHALGFKADWK